MAQDFIEQDFSGSHTVTSRNPLVHKGATNGTKSPRFDAEGLLLCRCRGLAAAPDGSLATANFREFFFRDCPKRGTNNALSANLDVLGGKNGSKSAVLVLCKATGQAPLTLFGQSLHALG